MAVFFTLLLGLNAAVLWDAARHEDGLFWHFAISVGLMSAVILSSFLISFFVVSRTGRIARTARKIMDTGDLGQRIETDSGWDDLSHMSKILNAFLDRNEELVEGIKRVSDNIAHDLRTPLTRLRNNLEEMQKNSATPESFDALIDEADRLLGTFNALLRIARIETAQQKTLFGAINLAQILKDVAELYEPLAEEKNISLQLVTEDGAYTGDKDLLFQAFANLVDNAIKFSPQNGHVRIILRREANGYICIFRDEGPGIPDTEKEKVFTRFYRGEYSRHAPGNGLGLSLAAAVIRLHNGTIEMQDATPGLLVKILL
jgi:signal transduction histidine kinase